VLRETEKIDLLAYGFTVTGYDFAAVCTPLSSRSEVLKERVCLCAFSWGEMREMGKRETCDGGMGGEVGGTFRLEKGERRFWGYILMSSNSNIEFQGPSFYYHVVRCDKCPLERLEIVYSNDYVPCIQASRYAPRLITCLDTPPFSRSIDEAKRKFRGDPITCAPRRIPPMTQGILRRSGC
jgi:hypothetical protein